MERDNGLGEKQGKLELKVKMEGEREGGTLRKRGIMRGEEEGGRGAVMRGSEGGRGEKT